MPSFNVFGSVSSPIRGHPRTHATRKGTPATTVPCLRRLVVMRSLDPGNRFDCHGKCCPGWTSYQRATNTRGEVRGDGNGGVAALRGMDPLQCKQWRPVQAHAIVHDSCC